MRPAGRLLGQGPSEPPPEDLGYEPASRAPARVFQAKPLPPRLQPSGPARDFASEANVFGLAGSYMLLSILQLPLGLAFTLSNVGMVRALGAVTLVLGVIGVLIAVGLWRLYVLGYVFAILLTIFNLIGGVFLLFGAEAGGKPSPTLGIGIGVQFVVLALLGRPTTARLFWGGYPGKPSEATFSRPAWHTSPYFWGVTIVSIGCNLLPLAFLLLVTD